MDHIPIDEQVGAATYSVCSRCGAKRMYVPPKGINKEVDTGWAKKKSGTHLGDAKRAWYKVPECDDSSVLPA